MADTAALVVALSAQLTKFEKDMKGAVDIANKRTKEIENSFTKMNAEINNQLSTLATGFASRLGPLGNILSSLGPIGIGVAASLGTVAASLVFITGKVEAFAQRARDLKEAAETLGLTTTELKALSVVGQQVGLDSEQTEKSITRLLGAVNDLRTKGSGPLFDFLVKNNQELIKQVSLAKDNAEAIDILSDAYKQLNKQQQEQFNFAVFSRRNITGGRLLGALPEGGLTQKAQEQLDKGFSPELIDRVAKLRQEIEAIQKRTDNLWGTAFAAEIQPLLKSYAELWERIAAGAAKAAEAGRKAAENTQQRLAADLDKRIADLQAQKAALEQVPIIELRPGIRQQQLTKIEKDLAEAIELRAKQQKAASDQEQQLANLPLPQPRLGTQGEQDEKARQERIKTLTFEIELMQRWQGPAEAVLTLDEKRLLKKKELELASLQNVEVDKRSIAIMDAYTIAQQQQVVALHERLQVATEQEIVDAKLSQARLDAAKAGQANIDLTKAEIVFRKQAKEAIEGQAVALSKLPESLRFSQEALDTFKQIDKLLVSTASSFENTFADIATSSKTASEAFKALADSIIRDLVRVTIRMAVTGPLLKSIGGLFTPAGAGGGGFDFSNLFSSRQGGGPVRAGSPYVVGEHGPELFVPQSAGKVVPNALSSGRAAGGTSVEINNYVAADTETKQTRQEGPTGDRIIIDIVKKAQARGELDDVNRGRFGLRPAKVR